MPSKECGYPTYMGSERIRLSESMFGLIWRSVKSRLKGKTLCLSIDVL